MTPDEAPTPERHQQVLDECERLIARNAELEARLAAERVWRSDLVRALGPLTAALGRDVNG